MGGSRGISKYMAMLRQILVSDYPVGFMLIAN